MTVKDQLRILDRKIKQNKANYDLYRAAAEVSALSSAELDKHEYLTKKDLNYKPDPIQKAKIEYSFLGQVFNKGLESSERQECLLKRLKNIEDKADSQLDLIKNQGSRQLQTIKSVNDFYYGLDREMLELQERAIRESIENITDEDKIFSIKINEKPFKIDKYTNLAYFGKLLFKGIIPLERVKEQQKNILNIINEFKKSVNQKIPGRPLSKENKDDAENLIKNGEEIFNTRRDIIKAYKQSRRPLEAGDDDRNNDDDEGGDDRNDEDDDKDEDDEKLSGSDEKIEIKTLGDLIENVNNLPKQIQPSDEGKKTKKLGTIMTKKFLKGVDDITITGENAIKLFEKIADEYNKISSYTTRNKKTLLADYMYYIEKSKRINPLMKR